jgi:hypothetical protein
MKYDNNGEAIPKRDLTPLLSSRKGEIRLVKVNPLDTTNESLVGPDLRVEIIIDDLTGTITENQYHNVMFILQRFKNELVRLLKLI